MTDQIDQDADTRTERALTAYLRQELSAPATAIMGYAEMLMNDAVRSGRAALIDDLRQILDAKSESLWPNTQPARSSGDSPDRWHF